MRWNAGRIVTRFSFPVSPFPAVYILQILAANRSSSYPIPPCLEAGQNDMIYPSTVFSLTVVVKGLFCAASS